MNFFRVLLALFFFALSGLSLLGAVVLFFIALGGGIIGLSYISRDMYPLPVYAEILARSEWVWRMLELSTYEERMGALVVLTFTAILLFAFMSLLFTISYDLGTKLFPALDE